MNRYQVRRLLRVGGMGLIHEARRIGPRGTEKRLAIKRIRADLRARDEVVRRFENECGLHWNLPPSRNVVMVYDVGTSVAGELFMAMELVEGASLREIMSAHGRPLSHEVIRRILYDVAAALDHIHGHEIVHRDLSPSNILVSLDGSVKLIDFGLASRVGDVVMPGFQGTAAYASPEALQGQAIGPPTDLYSLGAIVHELLTSQPPLGHGNATAIRERMQSWSIESLPAGVPDDLREITLALLERDAARRPESGNDVMAILDRYEEPFAGDAMLGRLACKAQPPRELETLHGDVVDVVRVIDPLAPMSERPRRATCGHAALAVPLLAVLLIIAFAYVTRGAGDAPIAAIPANQPAVAAEPCPGDGASPYGSPETFQTATGRAASEAPRAPAVEPSRTPASEVQLMPVERAPTHNEVRYDL